jgi:hypothetical protein
MTLQTGRADAQNDLTKYYYASDARTLYGAIAAPDKALEFVKTDHYLQEPATARAQTADLIAAWAASRAH